MQLFQKLFRPAPAKKKLIIHAGGYKTGTTYFQQLIYENRQTLLEHGVVYPEQGLGLKTNHNRYAHRLLGINLAKGLPTHFPDIINDLTTNGTLNSALISYEGFSQPETIERLAGIKGQFKEIDLHVVLVLRPHVDFLISLHRELCQHVGFKLPLHGLLHPRYPKPKYWNQILFYRNTVAAWRHIVPSSNIHVLAYNTVKEHLPEAILQSADVSCPLQANNRLAGNSTISAPMAAVMQRINELELKSSHRHALANEVAIVDAGLPELRDYTELSRQDAASTEQLFAADRKYLKAFGLNPEHNLRIGKTWKWGHKTDMEAAIAMAKDALMTHLTADEFTSLRKVVESAL